MDFSAFFDFKKMITPVFIKFIFYLGLAGVVIYGLFGLSAAAKMAQYSASAALGATVVTLLWVVGGAIGVRIWCELMIVVFKINENLQAIRDAKTGI